MMTTRGRARKARDKHTALRLLLGALLVGVFVQSCSTRRVSDSGVPNPKAQAAFERGSVALESGRYSEAIPDLYTVLDEHPSHLMARYNLGVALLRVKQYKESVEVMTAAHEHEVPRDKLRGVHVPRDVDADYLHALGMAYQELRDYDKSLACFDAAVDMDRAHLKSYYGRALTLEAQGDLGAARAAWMDYLKRDAESAWGEGARRHLAQIEERLKEQEDAAPREP